MRSMKSKDNIFVGGVLLAAFALRLIALAVRPMWYDETFAFFLAEKDFGAIIAGTAADTMPPLYYFLLHIWIALVGPSPFALRMLSVSLSMVVVALVYVVTARGLGRRAGLWAAGLTALASFQIYHAQELRMYALLAATLLLYVYAVIRFAANVPRAWMLVALSTVLALYSHNLAFLTLMSANVYFLLKRNWRKEIKLLAAQALGGLGFAPWLIYLPTQFAKIQRAFWTEPPGLTDLLQALMVFTTYLPLPTLELAIALFITLAIFALATLELARWMRRGASPMLELFIAFVLVPPALMFFISYVMRPVFVPRGMIASSLVYYAVLGLLAARAPRASQMAMVGIVVIIATGVLPVFYTSWGEWRRAPFAQADQFLRAQTQTGDIILHDNKLSYFSMRYYDRALPQEFLADPVGSSNDTLARASQEAMEVFPVEWNDALRGHSHIWFVIFQTALDEAEQAGQPHGNLARLDATMRQVSVTAFGDLRIYRYDAP